MVKNGDQRDRAFRVEGTKEGIAMQIGLQCLCMKRCFIVFTSQYEARYQS
jgi:hypothetical protein